MKSKKQQRVRMFLTFISKPRETTCCIYLSNHYKGNITKTVPAMPDYKYIVLGKNTRQENEFDCNNAFYCKQR